MMMMMKCNDMITFVGKKKKQISSVEEVNEDFPIEKKNNKSIEWCFSSKNAMFWKKTPK